MVLNNISPLKETSICETCIHKCIFKDVTLCNIDLNPSLFYHNSNNKPITKCSDYTSINGTFPKINVHAIWDWCAGFVSPTPVILCCKHTIAEYEHQSIEEIYPHCYKLASDYNIKLKGFPWIINIAEVYKSVEFASETVRIYRTNLMTISEILEIVNKINPK